MVYPLLRKILDPPQDSIYFNPEILQRWLTYCPLLSSTVRKERRFMLPKSFFDNAVEEALRLKVSGITLAMEQ